MRLTLAPILPPLLTVGFALVGMAQVAKLGLVNDWSRLTRFIVVVSKLFGRFGTDIGGMIVSMSGEDVDGTHVSSKWTLYADDGAGPHIPTITALIIARKLLNDRIEQRGAVPCLGFFTLKDFEAYADALGLRFGEEHG